MTPSISNLWRALEALLGPAGVSAEWRPYVGDGFDVIGAKFLQRASAPAQSYPCPRDCGCHHKIVRHDDGRIMGICDCESWNCDDLSLTEADLTVYELNWKKLGRAVAAAFGCDYRFAEVGVHKTHQIATFSGLAVPVILSIQFDPEDFRNAVAQITAGLRRPFILLAPTGRWMDARGYGLLAGCEASFFDLESHLTILPSGALQALRPGLELFAGVVKEQQEPVPENVARRAFELIEQLDSEKVIKLPSVLTVFRLYCVKELTAERVARKCQCSKGTIINRLKLIREKIGMPPDELRRFSSHFDKIEDDIRGSKASHVHRKRLIDDSSEPEEGE